MLFALLLLSLLCLSKPLLLFLLEPRSSHGILGRSCSCCALPSQTTVVGAFANTIIIRPAVMFGPTRRISHHHSQPAKTPTNLPDVRHRSDTPAYVEDVAEAIVRAAQTDGNKRNHIRVRRPPRLYYEELLRAIAREAGLKRILIPVPFAALQALAWLAEMMPSPPITRNQVELMQVDNVPSSEMPGFGQLGISPYAVEETLQELLRKQ